MSNAQTFHDLNQEVPSGLFTDLIQAWGFGSLGNMQQQRIPAAEESFPGEAVVQAHLSFNAQFESASPRTRLRSLKAMRFTAVNKQERVHRSLHALSQPLQINLSPAQWELVAELAEEDEE
jgi:hypothetical protein